VSAVEVGDVRAVAGIAYLGFVIVACVLLFVVIPRRRLRAVEALQSQLAEGDEIMTTGGLFGRITRLEQDTLELEIAPGTVVRFARGAVSRRMGDTAMPDAPPADETTD
jgi:preprotein translocase subunit YajC